MRPLRAWVTAKSKRDTSTCRSDSQRAERFRYWGLKRRTNDEGRQQFIAEVNPILESMGLEVPDPLKGRKYL